MNVKQIEVLFFRNRCHLRRERECVGLMFEERIRHHFHFVKSNALIQLSETRGQSRGYEVDSMAAFG